MTSSSSPLPLLRAIQHTPGLRAKPGPSPSPPGPLHRPQDLVRKRALTAETVEQWRQNALDSEAKRDRKVEHMKKVNEAKSVSS